jgi:HD-GYP domain-containing protein (c-di-GMP phosphodiesterase class II)/DNA-binding CsgD family transcriptional regulator
MDPHLARHPAPVPNRIRLAEILAALSIATDLANAFPLEKGLRNCLLAVLLGRELGLETHELTDVYYFALLRSIGCTSYAYEEALATGDDQNFRRAFAGLDSARPADVMRRAVTGLGAGRGPVGRARAIGGFIGAGRGLAVRMSHANCEAGSRLAERLGLGPTVCAALAQVHERWDGKGIPAGVAGEQLTVPGRIGVFAHDVTVHYPGIDRARVREMARRRSGGEYDPRVAEAFLGRSDHLLDALEAETVWDAVLEVEAPPHAWQPESRLDTMAAAFADFVDLKSPYTLGHSSGVAALAGDAARRLGCADVDVTAVGRAALMHDLGRASVSNAIWDKPKPLTSVDWERVRLHPYYTERVLERASALRPLARLAGAHHERVDSSGYHRGDPAALQPLPARVLAAADAYHAMTEVRPHRDALSAETANRALMEEASEGRLDRDAVRAVLESAGQTGRLPRARWPADLTDREVDVLRLAVRGATNQRIAAELHVSEDTVKTHVRHIYEKVGCSSRARLALFAMENGLIRD